MEDNSCVMKYIEIVPCDNYNNCSDVPDIKQEPVYVKVSTACRFFLFCVFVRDHLVMEQQHNTVNSFFIYNCFYCLLM